MTGEIFNDLLFDSLESQQDFRTRVALLSQDDQERYTHMLGKPSQFVGRVLNYDQAERHWALWQQYIDDEKRRRIATKREERLAAKVEAGKLTIAEVEQARIELENVKAWARKDEADAEQWAMGERARIRQVLRDFDQVRKAKVNEARMKHRTARGL